MLQRKVLVLYVVEDSRHFSPDIIIYDHTPFRFCVFLRRLFSGKGQDSPIIASSVFIRHEQFRPPDADVYTVCAEYKEAAHMLKCDAYRINGNGLDECCYKPAPSMDRMLSGSFIPASPFYI